MTSPRFANTLPLLAVLGSVTALGVGTSFAKQLFPVVGSLGTTALRVGLSALLLLALAIEFSGPLAVTLFSSRKPIDFVWLALAVAGLSLLLPLGNSSASLDTEGVLYALAGAVLLEPHTLLFGLGVAAVSSAIPISLEMVALKRLPQEAFGIMTSMEPAVAALLGLLMLHEHLTLLQWLAICFTMLAAAGSSVTAHTQSHLS